MNILRFFGRQDSVEAERRRAGEDLVGAIAGIMTKGRNPETEARLYHCTAQADKLIPGARQFVDLMHAATSMSRLLTEQDAELAAAREEIEDLREVNIEIREAHARLVKNYTALKARTASKPKPKPSLKLQVGKA